MSRIVIDKWGAISALSAAATICASQKDNFLIKLQSIASLMISGVMIIVSNLSVPSDDTPTQHINGIYIRRFNQRHSYDERTKDAL